MPTRLAGQGLGADDRALVTDLYAGWRRFAGAVGPVEVEPDDLVHEALLQTLTRQPLSDLDNPGAYVRAAMVNLAANHRRRLGRHRRAVERLPTPAAQEDECPSSVAELLTLSPDLRAALYLSEVEGWASGDVGAVLGCSAAAARQRVVRALRQLRGELADDGEEARDG
jgi:DNA-directed RNA polymerase specialized sigma24 family protein